MEVENTSIEGLLVIKPKIFSDNRGYFFESYNIHVFEKMGIPNQFLQDNESLSAEGVLRGLHFQKPPYAQGKLVRVITGSVLDVAVDIRKDSSTYGKHHPIILSAENKTMFWIPAGFAHGFIALENDTIFSYKCTNIYNQESEECIDWNDPILNIDWKNKSPKVSIKDIGGMPFELLKSPF